MHVAAWLAPGASPEMDAVQQESEASIRALIESAQATGSASKDSLLMLALAARALIYGLARMFVDGHLQNLGVAEQDPRELAEAVIDVLGMGLVRR